jgi:hypothetical protein
MPGPIVEQIGDAQSGRKTERLREVVTGRQVVERGLRREHTGNNLVQGHG